MLGPRAQCAVAYLARLLLGTAQHGTGPAHGVAQARHAERAQREALW
jgi:hypothetical protein